MSDYKIEKPTDYSLNDYFSDHCMCSENHPFITSNVRDIPFAVIIENEMDYDDMIQRFSNNDHTTGVTLKTTDIACKP